MSLPILREFFNALGIYDMRPAQRKFDADIAKICRGSAPMPSFDAWTAAPRDMKAMG